MWVVLLLSAYVHKTEGILCRIWSLGQIQVTFKNGVYVVIKTTRAFAFCKKHFIIAFWINDRFYKFLPFCKLRQGWEMKETRKIVS